MLINSGLWIMTSYWNKLSVLDSLRHLIVIAMSLCLPVVSDALSVSWDNRVEWAVVELAVVEWAVGIVRL